MASLWFALASDNRVLGAGAVLINAQPIGIYPGRPPVNDDPQYPMTNLLNDDRASLWSCGATISSQSIEFDLTKNSGGADVPLDFVAVHGFRWPAGYVQPAAVDVSYRVAAAGYSAGAWTALKSGILLGPRDAGFHLAAPVKGRYLRFAFATAQARFSVGNLVAALMTRELPLYSPGAEDALEKAEVWNEGMSRMPAVTRVGDSRRSFALPWRAVLREQRDLLRAIAAERAPITYISPEDEVMQVRHRPQHVQVHVAPQAWDSQLELVQLP